MIDPRHDCWWTQRRTNELRLAESGLGGAGVSLEVLLRAFAGQELVWYSRVYGDHDDDVLCVAVNRATAASLEKLPPRRPTPAGAPAEALEEHALSDEVAARLGITFEWHSYSIERHDLIRYSIYVHDDCFFFIEPPDDDLTKQITHAIRRMHSFYLGGPVDWTDVLDPIRDMLTQRGAIRLTSDPHQQSLAISWEIPAVSFFARIFKRTGLCEVHVDAGRAYFTGASWEGV